MYWKCLLSATVLFQIAAIVFIFLPVGWLHASSLTILITIMILGNVMSVIYKTNFGEYCRINPTGVGNIAVHTILPALIAMVLVWKNRKTQESKEEDSKTQESKDSKHQSHLMSWENAGLSGGVVIGMGVLYFLLMRLDWVCTYGVGLKTHILYTVVAFIMIIAITPFSLSVFNKK